MNDKFQKNPPVVRPPENGKAAEVAKVQGELSAFLKEIQLPPDWGKMIRQIMEERERNPKSPLDEALRARLEAPIVFIPPPQGVKLAGAIQKEDNLYLERLLKRIDHHDQNLFEKWPDDMLYYKRIRQPDAPINKPEAQSPAPGPAAGELDLGTTKSTVFRIAELICSGEWLDKELQKELLKLGSDEMKTLCGELLRDPAKVEARFRRFAAQAISVDINEEAGARIKVLSALQELGEKGGAAEEFVDQIDFQRYRGAADGEKLVKLAAEVSPRRMVMKFYGGHCSWLKSVKSLEDPAVTAYDKISAILWKNSPYYCRQYLGLPPGIIYRSQQDFSAVLGAMLKETGIEYGLDLLEHRARYLQQTNPDIKCAIGIKDRMNALGEAINTALSDTALQPQRREYLEIAASMIRRGLIVDGKLINSMQKLNSDTRMFLLGILESCGSHYGRQIVDAALRTLTPNGSMDSHGKEILKAFVASGFRGATENILNAFAKEYRKSPPRAELMLRRFQRSGRLFMSGQSIPANIKESPLYVEAIAQAYRPGNYYFNIGTIHDFATEDLDRQEHFKGFTYPKEGWRIAPSGQAKETVEAGLQAAEQAGLADSDECAKAILHPQGVDLLRSGLSLLKGSDGSVDPVSLVGGILQRYSEKFPVSGGTASEAERRALVRDLAGDEYELASALCASDLGRQIKLNPKLEEQVRKILKLKPGTEVTEKEVSDALEYKFYTHTRELRKRLAPPSGKDGPPGAAQANALLLATKCDHAFFARGASGLCSVRDTWTWNSPDYLQMSLLVPSEGRVFGSVQLVLFNDHKGRRSLLPRINIIDDFPCGDSIAPYVDGMISAVREFALANGLIPYMPATRSGVSSHRDDINARMEEYHGRSHDHTVQVLEGRNYDVTQIFEMTDRPMGHVRRVIDACLNNGVFPPERLKDLEKLTDGEMRLVLEELMKNPESAENSKYFLGCGIAACELNSRVELGIRALKALEQVSLGNQVKASHLVRGLDIFDNSGHARAGELIELAAGLAPDRVISGLAMEYASWVKDLPAAGSPGTTLYDRVCGILWKKAPVQARRYLGEPPLSEYASRQDFDCLMAEYLKSGEIDYALELISKYTAHACSTDAGRAPAGIRERIAILDNAIGGVLEGVNSNVYNWLNVARDLIKRGVIIDQQLVSLCADYEGDARKFFLRILESCGSQYGRNVIIAASEAGFSNGEELDPWHKTVIQAFVATGFRGVSADILTAFADIYKVSPPRAELLMQRWKNDARTFLTAKSVPERVKSHPLYAELLTAAYRPGDSYFDMDTIRDLVGQAVDRQEHLLSYKYPEDGWVIRPSEDTAEIAKEAESNTGFDSSSVEARLMQAFTETPGTDLLKAGLTLLKGGDSSVEPEALLSSVLQAFGPEEARNKLADPGGGKSVEERVSDLRLLIENHYDEACEKCAQVLSGEIRLSQKLEGQVRKILKLDSGMSVGPEEVRDAIWYKLHCHSKELRRKLAPRQSGERQDNGVLLLTKADHSFFSRGAAGLCSVTDTWSWNNPDYLQMSMIVPGDARVYGNVQLNLFKDDKGRRAIMPRINICYDYPPNGKIDPYVDQILTAVREFARANDLIPYLPDNISNNKKVGSNREDIMQRMAQYHGEEHAVEVQVLRDRSYDVTRAFEMRDKPEGDGNE